MGISRRDVLVGGSFGLAGAAVGAGAIEGLMPALALNVDDYRALAQARLPRMVFDYLEGGAGNERALSHNRAVFDQIGLQAHRLLNVRHREQSVALFGRRQASPFMIAPTGLNGALWPGGDIALARAAEKAGIPFALSTASTSSIEALAEGASGDRWFQLYVLDRKISEELLSRALAAGYSTLILTTDAAVNGLRERDVRNGFKVPMTFSPSVIADGIRHPRWSLDFVRNGMPQLANFVSAGVGDVDRQSALMSRNMDTSFDWESLKWLRSVWPHPLVVKGILRASDAERAVAEGADAVVLSNHGGRQLAEAISPLQVLAETRARIKQPILIDSGYRRGSDIVKALALGANGVLLGRATLYGLAARGEEGAADVIGILQNEIDNTLAQIGCARVADLSPDYLVEGDRLSGARPRPQGTVPEAKVPEA